MKTLTIILILSIILPTLLPSPVLSDDNSTSILTGAGTASGRAIPKGCPSVSFSYSDHASNTSIGVVQLNQGKGWGVVLRGCTKDGQSGVTFCGNGGQLPRVEINRDRTKVKPGTIVRECGN